MFLLVNKAVVRMISSLQQTLFSDSNTNTSRHVLIQIRSHIFSSWAQHIWIHFSEGAYQQQPTKENQGTLPACFFFIFFPFRFISL